MTRSPVPLAATLAAALSAAVVVAAPPAAAAPPQRPQTIPLETGSLPEGIAAGPGTTFFAGARSDGDIYVGDVRSGQVTRLVDRDAPLAAVGMQYDDRSGLLWVAGGGPGFGAGIGTVTAYRGSDIAYETRVAGAGFLNDLVVTTDAVYVTDTFGDALVVVPLGAAGEPEAGAARSLPLVGPDGEPVGGANGIRELPGGELVVVARGVLYAVDPDTGSAAVIEVSGRPLAGGDGLELRGRTLYVVNGYGGDEVVVLRLSGKGDTARTVGVLTAGELDRPTTGALIGGSLYVVNGRFGTLSTDPDADVYVTRLSTR